MQKNYDVIILGGGLAGLTLAMQIKQKEAGVSIAVLEMRKSDAPEAAHKVGESTVELGTHYLREVLSLKDYLDEYHLPKHGLRFFFSPQVVEKIEERVEFGARYRLKVPSHQIDRGVFENEMAARISDMGVDFILGARVKNVDFSEEGHQVHYTQAGETKVLCSTWVVDASGRAGLLKRQEGFAKEMPHEANAVWFRVEGDIDIDDWSDNKEWSEYLETGLRRLSTIHLMGKGYWVWFIPLSTGKTSVGIVADPRFHDFSEINTIDKSYDWLAKNEPQCAAVLEAYRDKVLDFKRLKSYPLNASKFYAAEKWGVVGEAGAFLDPFYSPGTDFIAIGNTFMMDLIVRDWRGEDVQSRAVIYDRVHSRFFENWIPIYHNKYELYDNAQLMTVKITWDWGIYWGIPTLLFTNDGFINMNILKSIFTTRNCLGERFGKLNKKMQEFYLDWGRAENEQISQTYVDPIDVPFMRDFHKGLDYIHTSDEELLEQLENNLTILEKMAAEIFRVVAARLKGTPDDMPVNPYKMDLKFDREKLLKQAESKGALAFDAQIAEGVSVLWMYEKAEV